ncbi:MAG: DUF58 domain-containing protein [Gammaproteobacteria bacterium]|nr:DUF58 domain-containing protein [Gammaproteobacteria bacterium]
MRLRDRLARALGLERFLVGEGPQPGPVELHRRRVYILPSRTGLGFALLLALLLLGATNYGNSLGFMLTFLLFGMAWAAMHHTYRNLVRLRVQAGTAAPVFAGSPARFLVELDDATGTARHALRLRLPDGDPVTVDVAGRDRAILSRPTTRRGWVALGRFTIDTVYPLGLFRAWAHVDLGQRCLVFPRPAPPGGPPPPGTARSDRAGAAGRDGDDFSGFRAYQPGDPPRHVYWKGVARAYGLLTKQFGGDVREELWLDWDQVPESEIEARLSRLCRWALETEAAGLAFGLRLPGATVEPGHGEAHLERCLTELALFRAGETGR